MNTLRILLLSAVALLLALLALTGLPTILSEGALLTGNALMLHVTAGGFLMALITILALLWLRGGAFVGGGIAVWTGRFLAFLFLASVAAAALPIVIVMTPLADSRGQHLLLLWHETAGIIALVSFLPMVALNLYWNRNPKRNTGVKE